MAGLTRELHLELCKRRARAYLDRGELGNAVASMLSDLQAHEETKHAADAMGMLGLLYASQADREGVRRFIDGFR